MKYYEGTTITYGEMYSFLLECRKEMNDPTKSNEHRQDCWERIHGIEMGFHINQITEEEFKIIAETTPDRVM